MVDVCDMRSRAVVVMYFETTVGRNRGERYRCVQNAKRKGESIDNQEKKNKKKIPLRGRKWGELKQVERKEGSPQQGQRGGRMEGKNRGGGS